MRSSRAVGATATLLAVLAASGCGGGSSDGASSSGSTHSKPGIASGEPTPPQSSTASSSASKTPTTKPTPKSSGAAAGAAGVPEPARQHTKPGAKAFVRYYMSALNKTGLHPKTGVLEPLALKSCKSCKNHQEVVQKLVARNYKFTKNQMAVKSVGLAGDSEVATFVEVHGYEPKVDIVDDAGHSVQSFPEVHDQGLVFELNWTPGGWRVATVKTVSK